MHFLLFRSGGLLLLLMIVLGGRAQAQSAPEKNQPSSLRRDGSTEAPSSGKGLYSTDKKAYKKGKRSFEDQLRTDAAARQKRIEKMQKERRRDARKADNPQFSDASYFGHKRPPKKRPLGKRKLCKECGIVH